MNIVTKNRQKIAAVVTAVAATAAVIGVDFGAEAQAELITGLEAAVAAIGGVYLSICAFADDIKDKLES